MTDAAGWITTLTLVAAFAAFTRRYFRAQRAQL